MDNTLKLISVLLAIIVTYLFLRSRRRLFKGPGDAKLPLCLPSLPIVGSLPFLGGIKDLHVSLARFAQKYGNVFGLYFGAKYYVIINGHEAIREALVKKSVDFADRGKFILDGIIWTDPGKGIILKKYGPELRTIRRNAITVLKSFGYGSSKIEQKITEEIRKLFEHIESREGSAWCPGSILESATLNVVYNLMLGERFDYGDEAGEFLVTALNKMAESADAVYDAFPLLMYLPNIKRKLEGYKKIYTDCLDFLEKMVEEKLNASGKAENFITEFAKMSAGEFSIREMTVIVKDIMIGGTETTSGQLGWALILLANHPVIQKRLQEEIDSVVPRERLPSLDDRPRVPYLEATILEVMRIRTAVPLSLNHCTTVDTEACGCYLPAKTSVLVNLWSAHMDPDVWNEPEVFRPERFMDDTGALTKRELMITFSLGKRSCLGEVLARQEMFLFLSAMIQQFNILPPDGEDKVKDEMYFMRTLCASPHTLRMLPRNEI